MDALGFVMGERAASLRVKHLSDLVYGAHEGQPVSDTARVSMRYCHDEDKETVFSRTITGEFKLHVTTVIFHSTDMFQSRHNLNTGVLDGANLHYCVCM